MFIGVIPFLSHNDSSSVWWPDLHYKFSTKKSLSYSMAYKDCVLLLQFQHPHLQPLCLTPTNECGVNKLICTFIKPTVVPYSHLYHVDTCAQFVADFIYYNQDHVYQESFMSSS